MVSTESILQTLQTHNALVDVSSGSSATLEPTSSQQAVREKLLEGEHCFILMGTTAGSAITMAKIAAIRSSDLTIVQGRPTEISTDADYMVSVRRATGVYLKKPNLFQAPVAWLFSSDPNSASSVIIRQRITTILHHLCIELHVGREPGYYASTPSSLVSNHGCTVVAVRHPMGLSEVYVDGCLAYPKSYSGALASVKESLGL